MVNLLRLIRTKAWPKMVISILIIIVIFCAGGYVAIRKSLAEGRTIVVTTDADELTSGDGLCSLREAMQNANNNAATNPDCAAGVGADTITFSKNFTITLKNTLPVIENTLTITGPATIDGNHHQILIVDYPMTATISDLTFQNGYFARPNLGLGGFFTLNIFQNTGGGAIYNSGVLTIKHCTFINNSTSDNQSFGGGAIYNYVPAALNITDSTFSNNSAPGFNNQGGAIVNWGKLNISNSTFSNNSAGSYSAVFGSLGNGGAIDNKSILNILNSTFSGNSASSGGAIYIFDTYAVTNIGNSTFLNNSATSGDADFGGGAIYNVSDYINVSNSTFSGNSAPRSAAIFNWDNSVFNIKNSIVANSKGKNCSGPFTVSGSNLSDDGSCANFNLSQRNPKLGQPTGEPAVLPLLPGSPAIDAVPLSCAYLSSGPNPLFVNDLPVAADERGTDRPQGSACDLGAYELPDAREMVDQMNLYGTLGFIAVMGIAVWLIMIYRRRFLSRVGNVV